MSPPSAHLVSVRSKVVIAALRSSGDRISGGSALASEPPEDGGPEKAPRMRPVKVCGGLLLPSPAVGDMTTSGYRRRWGTPNHPTAAGRHAHAGYGCAPADPPGRLAQLVRAQPSHG